MSFKSSVAATDGASAAISSPEAMAYRLYLSKPSNDEHLYDEKQTHNQFHFKKLIKKQAWRYLGVYFPLNDWSGLLDCRFLLTRPFFHCEPAAHNTYKKMLETLIKGHFTLSKKLVEFRFPPNFLAEDEFFQQRMDLFVDILSWLSDANLKTLRTISLPQLPPSGIEDYFPIDAEQADLRSYLIQKITNFLENTLVTNCDFPPVDQVDAGPVALVDTEVLTALQEANKYILSIEDTELDVDLSKGSVEARRLLSLITPSKYQALFKSLAGNPFIRKLILPNELRWQQADPAFAEVFNELATSISLEAVNYADGQLCLVDTISSRCQQNLIDHAKFNLDLGALVAELVAPSLQPELAPESKLAEAEVAADKHSENEIVVHLDCKAMTGHQFREFINVMMKCNPHTPTRCVFFATFNLPEGLFTGTKGRVRWRELQGLRAHQFDLINYQLYTGRLVEQPAYLFENDEAKSQEHPKILEKVKARDLYIDQAKMKALEESILIALGPSKDPSKKRSEQPVSSEQMEAVLASGRKAIWPMRYGDVQKMDLSSVESFVGWPFTLFLDCFSQRGEVLHSIIFPNFIRMRTCENKNNEMRLNQFTSFLFQRLAHIRSLRRIHLPAGTFNNAISIKNSDETSMLVPCRSFLMDQLKQHLLGVPFTEAINSSRVTALVGLPDCYNVTDREERHEVNRLLRQKAMTNVDNPGTVIFGSEFTPDEVMQALDRMFQKGSLGMVEAIIITDDVISPELVIELSQLISKNQSLEKFELPTDFVDEQSEALVAAVATIHETCLLNKRNHNNFRKLIHHSQNAVSLDLTEFRITPTHFNEFLNLMKAGAYKSLRALYLPEQLFTVYRSSGQLLREFEAVVLTTRHLSLSQVFLKSAQGTRMLLSDPDWKYYGNETIRMSVVENVRAFAPNERRKLYPERFAHQKIFAEGVNHRLASIARSCERRLAAQRTEIVAKALFYAKASFFKLADPAAAAGSDVLSSISKVQVKLASLPPELWLHILSFIYNVPQKFLQRLALPIENAENRELRLAASAITAQHIGTSRLLSLLSKRRKEPELLLPPAPNAFAEKLENALDSLYPQGQNIPRPSYELANFLDVIPSHLKSAVTTDDNRVNRIHEIRKRREGNIFEIARKSSRQKLAEFIDASVSGALPDAGEELNAQIADRFQKVYFEDIFCEREFQGSSNPEDGDKQLAMPQLIKRTSARQHNTVHQVVARHAIELSVCPSHELDSLDEDSIEIIKKMKAQLYTDADHFKNPPIKAYELLVPNAQLHDDIIDYRQLYIAFLIGDPYLATTETVNLVTSGTDNHSQFKAVKVKWQRLFNKHVVNNLLESTGVLNEQGPWGTNSDPSLLAEFFETMKTPVETDQKAEADLIPISSAIVNQHTFEAFSLLTNAGFSSKAIGGLILQQRYLSFLHAKNQSLTENFWQGWVSTIAMMCKLKVLYDLSFEYTVKLLFERGANLPTIGNPTLVVSEILESLLGRQLTKTAEVLFSIENHEWLFSCDVPNLLHFAGATDSPNILNSYLKPEYCGKVQLELLRKAAKRPLGLEIALGPLHSCFASPETAILLSNFGADFEILTPEQDPFVSIIAMVSDVHPLAVFLEVLGMPVQTGSPPTQLHASKFMHTDPLTSMVDKGRRLNALMVMEYFPELAKDWARHVNDLNRTVFDSIIAAGEPDLLRSYASLFEMARPWRAVGEATTVEPNALFSTIKATEAFIESKGQDPRGIVKLRNPKEFRERIMGYQQTVRYLLSDFKIEDSVQLNWRDPVSGDTAIDVVAKSDAMSALGILEEFSRVAHLSISLSYGNWAVELTPNDKVSAIDLERILTLAQLGVPLHEDQRGIKRQILNAFLLTPEMYKLYREEDQLPLENRFMACVALRCLDEPASHVLRELREVIALVAPLNYENAPKPRQAKSSSSILFSIRNIFSLPASPVLAGGKQFVENPAVRCQMAQLHLSSAPFFAGSRILTSVQNNYLAVTISSMSTEVIIKSNVQHLFTALKHLTYAFKTTQKAGLIKSWKLLLEIYYWTLEAPLSDGTFRQRFEELEAHEDGASLPNMFTQLIGNPMLTNSSLHYAQDTEDGERLDKILTTIYKIIAHAILVRNKILTLEEQRILCRYERFFNSATAALSPKSRSELMALYSHIDANWNYRHGHKEIEDAAKNWRLRTGVGPVRVLQPEQGFLSPDSHCLATAGSGSDATPESFSVSPGDSPESSQYTARGRNSYSSHSTPGSPRGGVLDTESACHRYASPRTQNSDGIKGGLPPLDLTAQYYSPPAPFK